ncbi:hypothetical protein P7H25_00855 [Paenibacillus larvae]|nr:hypothetical protein [Paenibacillus larvae]MDT2254498.1 hypothetical protein [Paenibacillus larvae]
MDMMNALTALVSGGSLPKDLSGKTGGAGDKAGGTSFPICLAVSRII